MDEITISCLQNMFIRYPTHMRDLSFLFLLILIQASSCTTRVIGLIGQNVTLPCTYDAPTKGGTSFCWGHGKVPLFKCSNTVLSSQDGGVVFRRSLRYQLLGRVPAGELSLTILNVQSSDAGVYGCRVEISGLFNDQKVNTELIIAEADVTKNRTPADATTKETLTTLTPKHMEVRGAAVEKSQTDEEIFTALLGVGNIGRMAVIFFLTLIIILILIIRRTALLRRPHRPNIFSAENTYEVVK